MKPLHGLAAWRLVGYVALGLVALVVVIHAWYAAHIVWWRSHPVGETSFMSHRIDELQSKNPRASLEYRWVPYDRISVHVKRAVVAAEDAKFVDHEGFDWAGIAYAIERNEKRGRLIAGGSTITQQLAKNLFLSPTRSWMRKGQEVIITVMLETMLPKRRILEIYLNVIELGDGVFGVEAASRRYFRTSAADVAPAQAARLAAMAPNPRFYERNPNAPGLNRKIGIILARMPASALP
ncbi:MAG TPA: monofunctional biosynthetic peptidoglycan transglycosylase [Casimicrobiaceae bacterium]|nr:monofunctional biosynthetic peptidoglycan transglycosylase [Casimicrobiaceae bacterium]